MSRIWVAFALLWTLVWVGFAQGQDLVGLARITDVEYRTGFSGNSRISVSLSQPLPYAVTLLRAPRRVRLSFLTASRPEPDVLNGRRSGDFLGVTYGTNGTAQSWLDFEIAGPMGLDRAEMTGHAAGARLDLRFVPLAEDIFNDLARADRSLEAPQLPAVLQRRNTGNRPWVIALDPGHGGIDPGAVGGPKSEADLMLLFAFELRDALRRAGYRVVMTRVEDRFVGLERRVSAARDAQADVFLSLHADAVLEGVAEGITVYTLSARASSEADAKLAARHDRHDILGGVDFQGQGDALAQVLMDMIRRETMPRAQSLAQAIFQGMQASQIPTNTNPIRQGDFAVLRAADIPSVLVELGFLSAPGDAARLNDSRGRRQLIDGILAGLARWTRDDAAAAALIRQ